MNISKTNMAEVARLTRKGRLKEAMAILRGTLDGAGDHLGSVGTRNQPAPEPIEAASTASFRQRNAVPPVRAVQSQPFDRAGLHRLREFVALAAEAPFRQFARTEPPLTREGKFSEQNFADTAGSLTYKLYVPSRHRGTASPLLVMLHGCTQSADDFAAGTRMNELAEEHDFLVAYPSQSAAANASRCWNWFNRGDQQRDRGEPSLIAGITRQIIQTHAVDRGRIYVAGLSAGGAAAAIMGATYPDLFAGVGIHSGLACGAAQDVASAFVAMRQGAASSSPATRMTGQQFVPTIVFHGDSDTTVNPRNSDQIISQLRAEHFAATVSQGVSPGGISYTRTLHADGSGRPMLEQWALHGAGHAWSGGNPAGSYTDPRGPDASREMLRFFLGRPATIPAVQ
jgi:poly(hydroxyalkanoate) depolymerase family esterase